MKTIGTSPRKTKNIFFYISQIITILLLVLSFGVGYDWIRAYQPAILRIFSGINPYQSTNFLSPPWIALGLAPFAVFTPWVGGKLVSFVALGTVSITSYKLNARPITMILILLSPPVLHLCRNANIDSIVGASVLLPPEFGIFLAASKPQAGLGLIIYWIYIHRNNRRQLATIFIPVILAYLLSFLFFGFYVSNTQNVSAIGTRWDVNLFPYGIPIGIYLIYLSIRRNEIGLALSSSPFFSPYVAGYTWSILLIGVSKNTRLCILLVALSWVLYFSGVPLM